MLPLLYGQDMIKEIESDDELPVVELPAIPAGRPAPALEEYVKLEVAITRAHLEATSGIAAEEMEDGTGRLQRSETYARWRHSSYMRGGKDGVGSL